MFNRLCDLDELSRISAIEWLVRGEVQRLESNTLDNVLFLFYLSFDSIDLGNLRS